MALNIHSANEPDPLHDVLITLVIDEWLASLTLISK